MKSVREVPWLLPTLNGAASLLEEIERAVIRDEEVDVAQLLDRTADALLEEQPPVVMGLSGGCVVNLTVSQILRALASYATRVADERGLN